MFQTTLGYTRPFGVPGEFFTSGPIRSQPGILHSADATYNKVGATAYTIVTPANGGVAPQEPIIVAAGGTGVFAGILCNPKSYASYGNTDGPLGPTMTLPNEKNAEFCTMGELIVTLASSSTPGDLVVYDNTTGALDSIPAETVFTASQATTNLTVSAVTAGTSPIVPGQVITGTGVVPGTRILSQSSGTTGGIGVYVVSTSATVGSTTMRAPAVAPTGKTLVPHAVVTDYDTSGSGLTVITLTN